MKNLYKKVIISVSVLFTVSIFSTTVFAVENIKDKFDKHQVSESDKPKIENALKKINYQQIVSKLYTNTTKVSFSEPIKIYTLENDNFLKNYNKLTKLTKYITNDYEIIQSIKDENGNVVGIVHLMKGKGLSEAKDALNNAPDQKSKDDIIKFAKENEGKWYVSSFGRVLSDEGTQLMTDFNVIEQKLHDRGIDKIKDLYILATNGYLPNMIYIQTQNDEYVMPIAMPPMDSNYKTGNLYKLADLIDNNTKYFEQLGEYDPNKLVTLGGVSNTLPALQPVTHVDSMRDKSDFNIIVSVILLAVIVGVFVTYKYRFSLRKV